MYIYLHTGQLALLCSMHCKRVNTAARFVYVHIHVNIYTRVHINLYIHIPGSPHCCAACTASESIQRPGARRQVGTWVCAYENLTAQRIVRGNSVCERARKKDSVREREGGRARERKRKRER